MSRSRSAVRSEPEPLLPLEPEADPYATIDDEILLATLHLTWHELCELCSGIVPVRLKIFAEREAAIFEDGRVFRRVVSL